MNRNQIPLLFSLLLLSGCLFTKRTDKKDIEGTWTLYDVTAQGPESPDFNTEASLKGMLQTGSVISFFADSSFTKTEGNYDFSAGNWNMDGDRKLIVLTTLRDEKKQMLLQLEAPSVTHKSQVLILAKGDYLYKYIRTSLPLKDYRQDPFYEPNNTWRTAPEYGEDSTQVRERLANYLKHLALLLKAAKEREETVVSFMYSQGPVRIYNGGIGILPYEKIKRGWKNGFYNDNDARYAYQLYEDYLSEGHYIGATTGEWIEDDYRILMSIYPAFHSGIKERSL